MSSVTPLTPNIEGLPERWAACSEGRDGARHVQTEEALALARAVETSLARNRVTADLTRTAREWGARLPSPSVVVSAVASLREAVTSMHEAATPLPEETPFEGPDLRSGARVVRLQVSDSARTVDEDPSTSAVVPANVLKVLDRVLSEAIEGVSSSLREAALIDPLTGCANRRALTEDLERAVAGARRTGLDVAVAVIDLDGLKQINDTNGHAAGDATLQDLARSLRAAGRDTDNVYRVGGDEFVVLIPFSGTGGAAAAMQRARAEGAPSFSWGAASLSMLAPGSDVDELIALADASLYASRRNVRPITSARPRRPRRVLVGAAAAAAVGIGVSSALVLPSSPQQAAIGALAPTGTQTGSGSGGGHTPGLHLRISVPSPSNSNPPALHRAAGTEGPSGGSGTLTGSNPGGQPAVLTVATVTPSIPAGKVTRPAPSGPSGPTLPSTPPLPGRHPRPPGVGTPTPGPLPWTVHPKHHPGHHGQGGGGHGHGGEGHGGHGHGGQGHGGQGHGGHDHARHDARHGNQHGTAMHKGLLTAIRWLASRVQARPVV